MNESELMAQFEREYFDQFPDERLSVGAFVSRDGVYLVSRVHVAYVMWKRAKREVRYVTLPKDYTLGVGDWCDPQSIEYRLEEINVKAEFV